MGIGIKKPRVCVICGEQYKTVRKSQTCSPKCRGLLKSLHYSQKLICEVCGKEFTRANSTIANGRDKTCSTKCMYKLMSTNKRGDKHWNWQGGLDKKECPICGKDFEYSPNGKKVQQFCSHECKYKHLANAMSGDGNNLWKGGTTLLNKKLRFELKEWKMDTLKKCNYTCSVTGGKNQYLEVHHATPFYKVRDNILKKLKLEYQRNRSEYTNEELENIVMEFKKEHKKVNGYPMIKALHQEFHKQYGYKTTEKQFLIFTKDCREGCLKFQP